MSECVMGMKIYRGFSAIELIQFAQKSTCNDQYSTIWVYNASFIMKYWQVIESCSFLIIQSLWKNSLLMIVIWVFMFVSVSIQLLPYVMMSLMMCTIIMGMDVSFWNNFQSVFFSVCVTKWKKYFIIEYLCVSALERV